MDDLAARRVLALDALIERRIGLRVEVYWTDLRGTLAVR